MSAYTHQRLMGRVKEFAALGPDRSSLGHITPEKKDQAAFKLMPAQMGFGKPTFCNVVFSDIPNPTP